MRLIEASREYSRRHPVRWFIGFMVFIVLVAVIGANLINSAYGATNDGVSSRVTPCPGGESCWPAKKSARKFRQGYFQAARGFDESVVFANPDAARKVIVAKIERKLARASRTDLATARARLGVGSDVGCTDRCLAWKLYAEMMSDASCVSSGTPSNAANTCYRAPTTRPLTKKEVQAGGAVVFCGGAVVFGVAGSSASAGGTAFIAIWGAAACGWSFWASLDN